MVDGKGWGEVDLSLGRKRKETEGCWGTMQMRMSRSRFPVLTYENVAEEIKNGTNADRLPKCFPIPATTPASLIYASAVPTPISLSLM